MSAFRAYSARFSVISFFGPNLPKIFKVQNVNISRQSYINPYSMVGVDFLSIPPPPQLYLFNSNPSVIIWISFAKTTKLKTAWNGNQCWSYFFKVHFKAIFLGESYFENKTGQCALSSDTLFKVQLKSKILNGKN